MSPGKAPCTHQYRWCLRAWPVSFWAIDWTSFCGTFSYECTILLPTSSTQRKFIWQGVSEMIFVWHGIQASRIASLRHKFQSCLFRNDYCPMLPRKHGSLKHSSSNYLLRFCWLFLNFAFCFHLSEWALVGRTVN